MTTCVRQHFEMVSKVGAQQKRRSVTRNEAPPSLPWSRTASTFCALNDAAAPATAAGCMAALPTPPGTIGALPVSTHSLAREQLTQTAIIP